MNSDIVLKTIYEENNTNAPELAKAMGIGRAQPLYDIEKGKVKHLSFDYAEKIEAVYPQYFLPWLVTGMGTKYKQSSEIVSEDNLNLNISMNEKDKMISILLEKIEKLESENAELCRKLGVEESAGA
ncbi:helix-turn-helix domain-containing protein [Parabacteroides bouchesdurhonensis]|uniref:helix-turn-helix domain-containing protein n=1 Tax=Parabacteroides bouchesdurhonensis TaxID=1936995 RepID=UPI000C8285C6|nr:helix-turn-helix transcriptional regulator [Parabacteroides bouchesdurhonensis]